MFRSNLFSAAFLKMTNILERFFFPSSAVHFSTICYWEKLWEKLELHLRWKNISHKMWPGSSQCKNAVKRPEKGCQSSQTWSCLFTVIILMSHNECGNCRWVTDVKMLHVAPSCQSNTESEKQISSSNFHSNVSLGSISMQTVTSQHLAAS